MQALAPSADTPGTPPRAVPASGYRAWLACAAVGGLAAKAPGGEPPATPAVPPAPTTAC